MRSRTKTLRPRFEKLEDRTALSAGSLDPSFGTLGLVTTIDETHFVKSPNSARAVQVDGKIVVAGESQKFDNGGFPGEDVPPDFAVARYNLDGTLDTSFGGKGWVTVDFSSSSDLFASSRDIATAVVVQPDGRIVVAGYSNVNAADRFEDAGYEFALLRLNSDGSLDASFDGDGKLTIDFGDFFDDKAKALALRPDGKIVVSGNRFSEVLGYGFEVAQLNTDGSLDTSFSDDGKQFVDFGTFYDFNTDLALQPDGNIVLLGTLDSGWFLEEYSPNYDFAVARLNADGSFDTTFDSDGRQSIDLASDFDYGTAVAIQPDGKIAVSGNSFQRGSYEFAVARLNADGSLDTSFDGDAWQSVDFGGTQLPGDPDPAWFDEDAQDMALQPDGKIVVAGTVFRDEPFLGNNFAMTRFNADGSLDTSFDGDGRQMMDTPFNEVALGVALQPDSKLVVVGFTTGQVVDKDFALARLNGDGSVDHNFGQGGLLFSDFPRRTRPSALRSVATQEDGRIVAASGDKVVRYNADGTIDTTFGTDGFVTSSSSSFFNVEVQRDSKIVLAGGTSVTRLNANGGLDTTFGNAGTVEISVAALALAPHGKIVVTHSELASIGEISDTAFAVVRLNPDGSLDTSFASDGKQTINFGPGPDTPSALAIAPGGEIALAGMFAGTTDDGPGGGFAVALLKKDGRLDTSFGDGGKQIIDLEGRIEGQSHGFEGTLGHDVVGIAFQPNGQLVVAGTSSDLNHSGSTGDDFTVFRLKKDGRLDQSFDGDGWVAIDFTHASGEPSVEGAASSMALQPDGKIVVVGSTFGGDTIDFSVARLTKDGSLDTSFDGDGKQIIDFGLAHDYPHDMALDRDGNIVVVGTAGDSEGSSHFALARLEGKGNMKSPTISINDVERLEGHSGTTPFTFTVRLSRASKETVTVKYQTANGSASGGGDRPDYEYASGTLTFAPGETTKTVTVLVYGDREAEINSDNRDEHFEMFSVLLSQATGAAIADDRGTGVILDDDIYLIVSDVTKNEGHAGETILFTFTLTLAAPFDEPVFVLYRTQGGNGAGADDDYVYQEGELAFAPGETTKTITIEVIGDNTRETDETFLLTLGGDVSLGFSNFFGVGTILNDD
jgi:uncharacterized delta-60 repeat protein